MRRIMMAAIGTLPIFAFSLLPKPAAAETVLGTLLSPTTVADRRYDVERRDNDDRRDDWRDRNSDRFNDRRDRNGRYDDRQRYDSNGRYNSDGRYNSNGRYDSNWRYDNRRNNQRRVWVPAHWERGFLGIGRHWVAGHYDYTNR